MKISNHILRGVAYERARQVGAVIRPEIVILHDTAGRLDKYSSKDYLRASRRVSVHFVVERDGTITQLVATNRRAAHAGKSSYHGRDDCNGFSIGIEIVNPGRMQMVDRDTCVAWWKQEFGLGFGSVEGDVEGYATCEMETAAHGDGVWMDYTPEQIEAVEALLTALFRDIPTLTDITTHWYVSPGRKVDTNPLFPLAQIRTRVLGRDDPADAAADAVSQLTSRNMVEINVPASSLNMRRWPSFNPNIISSIPHGVVVPVLRVGDPTGPAKGWLKVMFDGREGWVVDRYTKPVE